MRKEMKWKLCICGVMLVCSFGMISTVSADNWDDDDWGYTTTDGVTGWSENSDFFKDGSDIDYDEYILPESEYMYLTKSDISNLTKKVSVMHVMKSTQDMDVNLKPANFRNILIIQPGTERSMNLAKQMTK